MPVQKFVLTYFVIIFLVRFFTNHLGVIGRIVALCIEGLAATCLLLFVMKLAQGGRLLVTTKYVALFAVFFATAMMGAVANDVQPGAVFSGLRNTMLYLPFFLVPLVYRFTQEELYQQFRWLMVLALIQLPIAAYQYITTPFMAKTLDHVAGTLLISSFLSIFLISCAAVLWSYILGGKLKPLLGGLLIAGVLAPTTINETKGTFLLLPVALMAPSVVKALHQRNYSLLFTSLLFAVFLGFSFMTAFTVFVGDELANFFLEGEFMDYLYSEVDENTPRDWGVFNEVGRIDAILFALKYISKDIVHLFFGYGIGNVSESFSSITLGQFPDYEHLGPHISTMSTTLWEQGLIGVGILYLGCLFVMRDAYVVAGSNSQLKELASAWVGVACVIMFAIPYKNILTADVVGILFWHFTGFIVAERVQLTIRAPRQTAPEQRAVKAG